MRLNQPSAVELIAIGSAGQFLGRRVVAWVDADEEAADMAVELGAVAISHREVRLPVKYKGRTRGKCRSPLRAA